MVKRIAGATALACAMALCAGCATIVHGTTERVQIDSTPPGAQVEIDDSQYVVTPSAVRLSRGEAHRLIFHKAGFEDAAVDLTSSTSGWILGNILAGGVMGIAIDAANGAGRKLSSDSVDVALTPLPSPRPDTRHRIPEAAAPSVAQPALLIQDAPTEAAPQDDQHPTVPPNGPPLEDFTDDEAGYRRPAPPSFDGQRK